MKKLISFALAVLLCIGSLSLFSCNDSTGAPPSEDQSKVSTWDGTVALSFSVGNGSEAEPYAIQNAAEFAFFAKSVNDGFQFENLFGYVEQIDAQTGERVVATNLYDIPFPTDVYTEQNCIGCETLPENHGFDETVWDLKDPASPKLKKIQ